MNKMKYLRCEGKSICNQKITTSLFRVDPCPGIDKVLEINYYCVPLRTKIFKGTHTLSKKKLFQFRNFLIIKNTKNNFTHF